ncbi:adenosylmethionine--8-amino-7-oxononanoate aminotransferase BioA, partial [Campylobacter jejuni]
MQNQILKNLDLEHIWHPCTQMKDHENLPLIPIKRAKGVWLYDFDDKAYMDCVSSWWVNL